VAIGNLFPVPRLSYPRANCSALSIIHATLFCIPTATLPRHPLLVTFRGRQSLISLGRRQPQAPVESAAHTKSSNHQTRIYAHNTNNVQLNDNCNFSSEYQTPMDTAAIVILAVVQLTLWFVWLMNRIWECSESWPYTTRCTSPSRIHHSLVLPPSSPLFAIA